MRFELIEIGRPITSNYKRTPITTNPSNPVKIRGLVLAKERERLEPKLIPLTGIWTLMRGAHFRSPDPRILSLLWSRFSEKTRLEMLNSPQACEVADKSQNFTGFLRSLLITPIATPPEMTARVISFSKVEIKNSKGSSRRPQLKKLPPHKAARSIHHIEVSILASDSVRGILREWTLHPINLICTIRTV